MYLEKLRRIKAAKDLYKIKDERITKYEKRPLLKILADRCYHSPEISETDDESDKNKFMSTIIRGVRKRFDFNFLLK
jgi:hypothetical protein